MKINNNKPSNNVKPSVKQPLLFPCNTSRCNKSYDSIDKLNKHKIDELQLKIDKKDRSINRIMDKLIKQRRKVGNTETSVTNEWGRKDELQWMLNEELPQAYCIMFIITLFHFVLFH